VAPDWDVFLHVAEVVEATQQQSAAVGPQVEVHLLTAVPAAHARRAEEYQSHKVLLLPGRDQTRHANWDSNLNLKSKPKP